MGLPNVDYKVEVVMSRVMSGLLFSFLLCAPAFAAPPDPAAEGCKPQDLDFANKAAGWTHLPLSSLKSDTRYSIAQEESMAVLKAEADSSASIFAAPLRPPGLAYGNLSWRWKTDALIPGADNRDKSREDAPVRVIAAFDGDRNGLSDAEKRSAKWAKRMSGREPPYATLIYIWSEQVAAGTIIPSAHSSQVKMLVAASGSDGLGKWQSYKRDLRADYKRAFGSDAGPLLGIGVMTDTDNTKNKAQGSYAAIRLECGK